MDRKVTGYSSLQVALHWLVVVLVAFQFLAHDGIEDSWRAHLRSEIPPSDAAVLGYLHISSGMLVLLLALLRLYLRMTRGAPGPPEGEPRLLQWAGDAVHWAIYLFLLLLPVTGSIAWFLGIEIAGEAHEWIQKFLLAAIALHIAGALFQHLVMRSQVLLRMFQPQRR